ncbi:uncharacterized protein F58A4.6 [Agrilus planipennis]|uniref:Uncharacterized protein F58A4.6 n=1 Tax=Agrilus planipennis TaxID=224129 RepID=A0A1W4WRW9_AGRPL|nr:uncharacterized protein F58A4.6 [Agrilus planipennis]
MDEIFLKIRSNRSSYGKYVVSKLFILEYDRHYLRINQMQTPSQLKVKLQVNGIFLHYFIRELKVSNRYKIHFMKHFRQHAPNYINSIKFDLIPPPKEIIDYEWNYRMEYLIRERCELENTFSWLSTLGGAFSALGDYYVNCAQIAGKISVNQFKLALRLGDESIVSRCLLFLSLSLIQQRRFKLAKHIVYREYLRAKYAPVVDTRLIKMCKGIWCKLQYEHKIRNKVKKIENIKINIK